MKMHIPDKVLRNSKLSFFPGGIANVTQRGGSVIILLMFLVATPACLKAQVNTFDFLYESSANKHSFIPIEDNDGNFITPISIYKGTYYSPSKLDRGFLLKFSPTGDTCSYYYSIPDTSISLTHIVSTADGGYLLSGSSIATGMDSVNLLLIKLNSDFEIDWLKQHYLYGNFMMRISRLFPLDDNGFILTGDVCKYPCATYYPYLAHIDKHGNIVSETIYNYFSGKRYEYMLNPARNRIWMFAVGLPPHTNGRSVTVLDITFAFISSQPLQPFGTPPYYAKWLNDTSFIYSYQARKVGLPYQDQEFTIEIHDTLFNVLQFDQFGLPDSYDIPATYKGLDFRHPDTIFYAASTGLAFGPPSPGYTNWFMVRQLDGQLQERYRHFYGGDAFYHANAIIATTDGGCFVSASKYKHDTDNFELFFLKLNSEGMLVGTNDPDIQQRMSLFYPNPATDEVVLETYLDATAIKVFDSNGRMVRKINGVKGKNTINLGGLPASVYVLSLFANGEFIETHKIIKQ
jgi:hypothetical protein